MTDLSVHSIKPSALTCPLRGEFHALLTGTNRPIVIRGNHRILNQLSKKEFKGELPLRLVRGSKNRSDYNDVLRETSPPVMQLLPDAPEAPKCLKKQRKQRRDQLNL
jgi:hypothetical protein